MLERSNTEQANRILNDGDRRLLLNRIAELEAALERANKRRAG